MSVPSLSKPSMPWDSHSLSKLRPYLQARGLRVSGLKNDRVADLEAYDKEEEEEQAANAPEDVAQAPQQQENAPTLATHVEKMNSALGFIGIDEETVEHMEEQKMGIEMFDEYIVTEHGSLQSTFGLALGVCWKIKKILVPKETLSAKVIQAQVKDSPKAKANDVFAYNQKTRYVLLTHEKKTDIKSTDVRDLIARATQGKTLRDARREKSPGEAMRDELYDLHENFLVSLKVHSLVMNGTRGGGRKWSADYSINQLSVTYPLLNEQQQQKLFEYVHDKKIDIRNMSMVYGVDELTEVTKMGLLKKKQ